MNALKKLAAMLALVIFSMSAFAVANAQVNTSNSTRNPAATVLAQNNPAPDQKAPALHTEAGSAVQRSPTSSTNSPTTGQPGKLLKRRPRKHAHHRDVRKCLELADNASIIRCVEAPTASADIRPKISEVVRATKVPAQNNAAPDLKIPALHTEAGSAAQRSPSSAANSQPEKLVKKPPRKHAQHRDVRKCLELADNASIIRCVETFH